MKVRGIKWLNLLLIVLVLGGYQYYAVIQQNRQAQALQTAEEQNWKDGTYEGEGTGFGGRIRVQVVVQKHRIQQVKILSAPKETKEYLKMAKRLCSDIMKAQSTDVDVVSGATYSSNGILEAVSEALEEAYE